MPTDVGSATAVVKQLGALAVTTLVVKRAGPVGLEQRCRWLVASGRVPSAAEWCNSAGLARQHLDSFYRRVKEYAEKVTAGEKADPPDMNVGSVEALAHAAGVDFAWLATGNGMVDGSGPSDPDRDAAVELLAQHPEVDEKILKILRGQPRGSAVGIDGWFARYVELRDASERSKEFLFGRGVDSSGMRKKKAL